MIAHSLVLVKLSVLDKYRNGHCKLQLLDAFCYFFNALPKERQETALVNVTNIRAASSRKRYC